MLVHAPVVRQTPASNEEHAVLQKGSELACRQRWLVQRLPDVVTRCQMVRRRAINDDQGK
jgi:hypothetical protein